jgi:penicillin G amidase
MAGKGRRILSCCLGVVLVLVLGAAGLGLYLMRHSFPQVDGELHVPGLGGTVEVLRDGFGVPHIYAASTHDLAFAQGYVQAQDRFWQMDVWRHAGSGRLSEMFGEATLSADKFLRTLGWARVVREELKSVDPESLTLLNSYAEGVNAYLAEHGGSALSLEYVLLGLRNREYRPEPWEPLHSLTWAKAMAWDLGSNEMEAEITRAKLLKILKPDKLDELYPPYPADRPTILPGGAPGQGLGGALGDTGLGSNNWVIGGARTSTGKPILANDPHLSVQMPPIWYEVGLHCTPVGPDCPYDVTGFSFPGAPGVVLGHNARIAWAMTNVGPDVMDLYIEKVNPDNPLQYEVNGQWQAMQTVDETIAVAGAKSVDLKVRITRHGPIVSDTFEGLQGFDKESGVELPPHFGIALRWTALSPSSTFQAIWRFNRAKSWEEFRDGARVFDVPSQNLVYADVDGNIGYQTPGKIPIRASGDGRFPMPGWTDEHEWTGFIPFEELPSMFNPPQGYIATANNAVVGAGYPRHLGDDWDYGYRAKRITQMIEEHPGKIGVEDVQKMQGDAMNLHARAVVEALLKLPLEGERLQKARSLLQGWDLQDTRDQAAPALFEVFWRHLLQDTFLDEVPVHLWPGGGSRAMTIVGSLLQQPNSSWWDNKKTPAVEDRDTILKQALGEALDELEKKLGADPAGWSWGALHTVTYKNATMGRVPVLGALFNRGPYPASGGSATVNATSWRAAEGFEVVALPSMRMIVDLSDLSRSRAVLTTGQSGHAGHQHYADMAPLWLNVETHPMLWDRAQVEAHAEGRLKLVPEMRK